MRVGPENGNGLDKRRQTAQRPDSQALALMALGWLLQDEQRARRLLDLTGLDAQALRQGLDDPAILGAVLGFLAAHEPDLLACADALDIHPETLITAARELEA